MLAPQCPAILPVHDPPQANRCRWLRRSRSCRLADRLLLVTCLLAITLSPAAHPTPPPEANAYALRACSLPDQLPVDYQAGNSTAEGGFTGRIRLNDSGEEATSQAKSLAAPEQSERPRLAVRRAIRFFWDHMRVFSECDDSGVERLRSTLRHDQSQRVLCHHKLPRTGIQDNKRTGDHERTFRSGW